MSDRTPPTSTSSISKPLGRRTFIKAVAGAGLGFALWGRFPNGEIKALAVLPGGTLNVGAVPKYAMPLVIPPAMPRLGSGVDYDISVAQFQQQILPTPYGKTTVWSYGPTEDFVPGNKAKPVGDGGRFFFPAFTIETIKDTPIKVRWVNNLVDENGASLPHLLPVDPSLHWANPEGGAMGRDMRPDFTGKTYLPPAEYDALSEADKLHHYTAYRGPVPIITHVHGMERAYEWSDGYPEAWYLPAARDIPSEYATEGTFYDFYELESGSGWDAGTATFSYPNSQRDSNAWYHDHTLGMTRLNVYAGPAGFYFIRDPSEQPTDRKTGNPAVLPGPAPDENSGPFDPGIYEIPLAIQDRSFNEDGSLWYPDTRAFFDTYNGPFIPESDISPLWNPEFFGNTIVVNGQTWPYLDVEPRRYRLRILNGCQSRFLILQFDKRLPLTMIGNEGGFLRQQVDLTELLLGPAERADVIVDFSAVKGSVRMLNVGPDSPFGGLPVAGNLRADPRTTGQVMEFRVNLPLAGKDTTTPPGRLVLPALGFLDAPTNTRKVALLEKMDMTALGGAGAVIEALLGDDTFFNAPPGSGPHDWAKMWSEPITENPNARAIEEWEIWNFTVDAHPIHLHEVFFEVVNRQAFDPVARVAAGPIMLPPAQENGLKDTVIAYPGQITRIRMQFGGEGLFVWHCHIVEHEDNEMMRPYHIGPIVPGSEKDRLLNRHNGMHGA